MVTTNTADNALKSYYLDAITTQLNMKISPFLAQIKSSENYVTGKDVKKCVRYGVNGGMGAGTETGDLPASGEQKTAVFTLPLANLYGTIEISDKAVRASQNNEGSFVNLLNEEMESLVQTAEFHFGRMLYGDGYGKIAVVKSNTTTDITVDTVKYLREGMIIDIKDEFGDDIGENYHGRVIKNVDRVNKKISLTGANIGSSDLPDNAHIFVQGSENKEILGLGAIFNGNSLYGVPVNTNGWMKSYKKTNVGEINEDILEKAIDDIEEQSGSKVNFILCSAGVRRALAKAVKANRFAMNTMEIEGGYTALSFNGIPVVSDKFCPEGTMYLLNTDSFCMHQLCDWQWLESEDGKILKQVAGKPVYTATLVKYCNLMCDHPAGQGILTGITEA